MLLLVLLQACEPGKAIVEGLVSGEGSADSGTPADDSPGPPPEDSAPLPFEIALTGSVVFEPVLVGPLTWSLEGAEDATVQAEILDSAGATVVALEKGATGVEALSWDGRDSAGARVPAGVYTLQVVATKPDHLPASATAEARPVRLGVLDGTLGGDRIALLWHQGFEVSEATDKTFVLSSIDADDGSARAIPDPWDDLDAAPEEKANWNLPAAYAWDAVPTLSLTVEADLGGVNATAAIEGWTLSKGGVFDAETLVFTRDAPLASGPRVVEETLVLRWTADDGTALGEQAIPLRFYALLGPPTFDSTESPYLPWVAIIDPALRAMDGVEPTDPAVLSALVDHVYNDLGLEYDTRWGASAYLSYLDAGWDSAHMNLSAFVSRSAGSVVNCSDCAGILTAYANMVGVWLGYSIIYPRFGLNYIKAIGGDEFTSCPFGGGGCSFSYHAVTTPDEGEFIFDATLALDGDEDPGSEPSEELLVQEIAGDEYLDRLVRSGNPDMYHYGTGTLR